jgi:tetratricopeptide (TPR) repeat protein
LRKFSIKKNTAAENKKPDPSALPPSLPVSNAGLRPPFLKEMMTGREEEIAHLVSALTLSSSPAQPIVIYGKPGSGKTQLAAAVCSQCIDHFQGIHWIAASQASDIALQVADIGQAMQITPWPALLPEQVEVTLQAWRQTPQQLIVFQHCDDPAILAEWVNKLENAAILITTAHPQWGANTTIQLLESLNLEEATAILRKLAPGLAKVANNQLAALIEQLESLPLGLSLAGRYFNDQPKTSPAEYLAEITKITAKGETRLSAQEKNASNLLPPSLAAGISLAYRLLSGKGERERLAQRIFQAASFCAPDLPIPDDLLRQAVEIAPEKNAAFERSLRWLYDLGLLLPTSQGAVIHASINAFSRLNNAETNQPLTPFVVSILSLTSETDGNGMPIRRNFSHMRCIAARAEEAGEKQADILWDTLGSNLQSIGDFPGAKYSLERSLATNLRINKAENAQTAKTELKLGKVCIEMGDFQGAKGYFEKALGITEKLYSPVYPEVATILNELGLVYFDLDDLLSAKASFERAIAIHEAAYGFGPKHPAIAIETANLGRVLRDMNDLPGAKKNFERALAVSEWVYGPKHPTIITYANYLGRVLYNLAEFEEAKNCFERVSLLLEATHGPEYPGLSAALNNWGLALQDLGNLNKAVDCYTRALQIDEKVFGWEHPNIARDANNLGGALSALGNMPAARDYFSRALEIDTRIFGEYHPNNSTNANNLGRVLYNLGDFSGAKKAFEQTLRIDEKIYGPKHTRVGTDANNLGSVLCEIGDLCAAKAAFQRALEIFQKELPADHPKTQKARSYLEKISELTRDC